MIDWFTVAAQGLNFLVLLWLMKRFLYRPILHAIDAREDRIAAELAAADTARTEAEAGREAYTRRREELEQQRAEIRTKAETEARARAEAIVDDARAAADALRAERAASQLQEARDLEKIIRRWAGQSVVAMTRQALTDLAGADLDDRLQAAFLERLEGLPAAEASDLGAAIEAAAEPVQLRSAMELDAGRREVVRAAIGRVLQREIPVVFVTDPELIGGMELRTDGMKIAWTVAAYVEALEEDLPSLLAGREGAVTSGMAPASSAGTPVPVEAVP